MRFHSNYPVLQLWTGHARDAMRHEHLAVARLEPALTAGIEGNLLLDLFFLREGQVAVLPFAQVQGTFAIERERSPIVWPAAAQVLGYDVLESLERELVPWLRSRLLARREHDEVIRAFGPRELFDRARSAGLLGATPYADLMPLAAPYVYAMRFCRGRSAGVQDRDGANGAALLGSRASFVRADLRDSQLHALAGTWFGRGIFGELESEYDLLVAGEDCSSSARVARITLDARDETALTVAVASAIPSEVLVSFDPDDAPAARTFAVRALAEPERRSAVLSVPTAPAGGSSGTIVLLMRRGFERAPDADVDEASALAARLRLEGFNAELRSPDTLDACTGVDLVHAFGVDDLGLHAALQRLRAEGVPVVVNAAMPAFASDALGGPNILKAVYRRANDEGVLAEYLDLLALRKLSADAAPQSGFARILGLADAAIAASAGEEEDLRAAGFAGEVVRYVPASASPGNTPANVGAVAGCEPFAFVHAPIEWGSNLPLLLRATAARDVPLAVAGPVVDVSALRVLQQAAPERFIHLPTPTQAQLEALYRTARVYADVSWAPRGYARVARAAAGGCRLLLSRALRPRESWPLAAQADPGSVESIAAALESAWNAPAPPPVAADGADLFSASILAYARAAGARRPA